MEIINDIKLLYLGRIEDMFIITEPSVSQTLGIAVQCFTWAIWE